MSEHSFSRTEQLIGKDNLDKIRKSKIAVVGIGGVGSYSVESLARSGVGKLILVDDDEISLTNINRQIHANTKTIGRPKVEVMKERILDINPQCEVTVFKTFLKEDNISQIIDCDVDYVIDAIDTISSKIDIILWCKEHNINIISSMGTGNKLDPTRFEIVDIYETKVCPLSKVMRRELKKRGVSSLKVLYSDEKPLKVKTKTPASISFVPPVAGMIIAGETIKDIIESC